LRRSVISKLPGLEPLCGNAVDSNFSVAFEEGGNIVGAARLMSIKRLIHYLCVYRLVNFTVSRANLHCLP
jgi:hypothetical protein